MTNERRVIVHSDSVALAGAVAARFITKMVDILDEQDQANIVLEGGRVGINVLASINSSPARDSIDWSRVHIWWSDERWLPSGDPERNETKARAELLDDLDIPAGNIHATPASDSGLSLDEAAASYLADLKASAPEGEELPRFDITFLGVGPDGHTASLFPGRSEVLERELLILAVRDSPKPPPERLTMTRPAINSSQRVWIVMAGEEKASVLGLALAGAHYSEVPVAGVKGRKRTVFFVDQEAAAEVPERLIAPGY